MLSPHARSSTHFSDFMSQQQRIAFSTCALNIFAFALMLVRGLSCAKPTCWHGVFPFALCPHHQFSQICLATKHSSSDCAPTTLLHYLGFTAHRICSMDLKLVLGKDDYATCSVSASWRLQGPIRCGRYCFIDSQHIVFAQNSLNAGVLLLLLLLLG